MTVAKLFWNGRSQAVRLPKEFRFEGEAVSIRRDGRKVILEPTRSSWPPGYWDQLGTFSDDLERPLQGRLPKIRRL